MAEKKKRGRPRKNGEQKKQAEAVRERRVNREIKELTDQAEKALRNKAIIESGEQVKYVTEKKAAAAFPYESSPETSRFLTHVMRLASLGYCDTNNPAEVEARIQDFINVCIEDGIQTSIPSLAIALGISKYQLTCIRNGTHPRPKQSVQIIEQACSIIEAEMIDKMQGGGINPVAGIFISRNTMGYTNEDKKNEEKIDPLGGLKDADEIAEKYKDMPDD